MLELNQRKAESDNKSKQIVDLNSRLQNATSDMQNLRVELNQCKAESDKKSKQITDLLNENKNL